MSVRRRAPPRGQRRESGIILVLAMFVIVLLLVIVPQFCFSAHVERELALNEVAELQMEALARAAILRAQAGLLVDLEDDKNSEQGDDALGGAGGGGGAAGGTGGTGGAGGAGGAGDQGGAGNHVDSLDEPWASAGFDFALGEEAQLRTRIDVSDEDAKLNLLLLAAEDPDYRKEWRARFERCLDLMRDGQQDDLSISDATELLDRMERWMRGERGNDQLATPALQTGDWKSGTGQSTYAPFSLAEFSLAGGMPTRLLTGFEVGDDPDDRKWVPGLGQGLTVWSNLEWKDLEAEEEKGPADVSNQQQARPEAQGVNNGRININTAPIWVLKSLFPDSEIPYSAWDEYETFRREALEEIKQKRDEARNGEGRDEDDPPDPDDKSAKYPLKTIDDLRKIDGFTTDSSSLTPARWDKLAMLLTVESNVFTITVSIATLEPPVRYYVARAVVWRRSQGGGDPRCLPIVPFERVGLSAVDLREFVKQVEEESAQTY